MYMNDADTGLKPDFCVIYHLASLRGGDLQPSSTGSHQKWKSLSRLRLFATPWAIQSMEFSRPEYWSRYPFPSPGHLLNPGIKPRSRALQADSLPAELSVRSPPNHLIIASDQTDKVQLTTSLMEGTQIPFKGHKMNPGTVHSWTGLQTTTSTNCPLLPVHHRNKSSTELNRRQGSWHFHVHFSARPSPHTHVRVTGKPRTAKSLQS